MLFSQSLPGSAMNMDPDWNPKAMLFWYEMATGISNSLDYK